MSRPRTLPDTQVFALVLTALADRGEKAVSFGNLSRACGLAPATLAQRFGSVDGMIHAALLAEWDRLSAAVEGETANPDKGAQALLKHLPTPSAAVLAVSLRDAALRQRAEDWRLRVETAVAARRGGSPKSREVAAMLVAAWYGRQLWDALGTKSFKLSDLMKRLG
jgi:AcrR family transcriptional regulator